MKPESVEIAERIGGRKLRVHNRLANEIFYNQFPNLFSQLGIERYKIHLKIVEPERSYEFPIPDLLFLYTVHSQNPWHLLLVEVKGTHTTHSLNDLEEKLSLWNSFIGSDKKRTKLYQILEGKAPLKVVQACQVQVAGVYETKKGKFRVHKSIKITE